jgi:hypothetical protein
MGSGSSSGSLAQIGDTHDDSKSDAKSASNNISSSTTCSIRASRSGAHPRTNECRHTADAQAFNSVSQAPQVRTKGTTLACIPIVTIPTRCAACRRFPSRALLFPQLELVCE